MSTRIQILLLALLTAVFSPCVLAQIAIPIHYEDYWWECWSIRERTVDMTVRDQVASVTITDDVVNPCPNTIEAEYVFPLPPDAAVDQFTLVVDGRELTGRILDANEARGIYNDIVRRKRDPGLLEYAGHGFYRSSAFPLGPNKTAQLVVHYSATCKKDGDIVELWYPMATGRFCAGPVEHLSITADIQSAADIANVYSPSVDLDIDRKAPNRVVARYEAHHYRPLADFELFYESSREQVGATFLSYWPDRSKDGYYLMLVSPSPRMEANRVLPKDIVVILDRSGSMSGEKIRQAKDAARFIFGNLNREDRFNLITYNDNPSLCFESLQAATAENIDRALDRLDRVDAGGSTNIYAALDAGMGQFQSSRKRNAHPGFIIFLTDGLPTVGNTNENAILENTANVNRANVRLFAFGVGYDVNVRLLDNLVNRNHGRSSYVKPNESIETKVSALYRRIKNPFMTNVTVALDHFGTRDDCPTEVGDLFEGDQLIRVGRIFPNGDGIMESLEGGDCPVTLTVSGNLQGEQRTFEYPVSVDISGPSSSYRFVEKLWAVRRVGQLMEEIQLHGRATELVDELIRLSKRYGIVTPYTSFLADEHRDLSAVQEQRVHTLSEAQGRSKSIVGPQAQMDAIARQEAMFMVSPKAAESNSGHAMRMGAPSQMMYESGSREEINTIRIIGNETLYKRGDTWVTASVSNLDPVRDRGKFKVIKRFSPEYFALAKDNSPDENQVFASQKPDEKIAILLRGTAYLIE